MVKKSKYCVLNPLPLVGEGDEPKASRVRASGEVQYVILEKTKKAFGG
jgi:hypothetical protein